MQSDKLSLPRYITQTKSQSMLGVLHAYYSETVIILVLLCVCYYVLLCVAMCCYVLLCVAMYRQYSTVYHIMVKSMRSKILLEFLKTNSLLISLNSVTIYYRNYYYQVIVTTPTS